MKNIDTELIDWAIATIKTKYHEDVALLIGQKGACKIPTDEQKLAFDFFVPCSKKGYQLAETFVIEDMGYDLFSMSWERLEGIANLQERITFALMNGVVLYARTKEEEERFLSLQQKVRERLADPVYTYNKSLAQIDVAMELYKTMMFEEKLSHVRKAAGGIMMYLSIAIATYNGSYLNGSYGKLQYVNEVMAMKEHPEAFDTLCNEIIGAKEVLKIRDCTHRLLKTVRQFFLQRKRETGEQETINYNYEDLASWYYEARYTFRRLEYYVRAEDRMSSYELGCYLQIEFDEIQTEFGLEPMDLMGVYNPYNLHHLSNRAAELEQYIIATLKEHQVRLKIYDNLHCFLEAQSKKSY